MPKIWIKHSCGHERREFIPLAKRDTGAYTASIEAEKQKPCGMCLACQEGRFGGQTHRGKGF